MALLSIANLCFSYGERPILDGVNLTLNGGEHVGLVGRNGCGKSTLLKVVIGSESLKPGSGQVQMARGSTVRYLTQDFDFSGDLTLRQEAGRAFAELAELRKSEPIHWVDVPGGTGGFGDKGYWLVTKHADVKEVSKRSDIFGSSPDGAIPVWPQEMTRDAIDLQKNVLLNMDAPQHTRLRKIISRGFTPRAIGRLRDELNERAQNIAREAVAAARKRGATQIAASISRRLRLYEAGKPFRQGGGPGPK